MLRSTPGKTKSEHVVDSCEGDEDTLAVYRPMSPPILARRAVRETPALGAAMPKKRPKQTLHDTMYAHPMCPKPESVKVEEVPEPQVNVNQVLYVPLVLHSVLSLQQPT